jgi:NAD-dependent DNA ligase
MMKNLKVLKFKVVNYTTMNIITEDKLSKYLTIMRKKSKYDIDGIIVTNNIKHKRNTSGNPKYAFAFKDVMEDQMKEAVVKDIDWKVSKDGKIVPTLILEPIEIGGVTIQRVTAHNAKVVFSNNINIGTVILLIRSGDVIPYIKKIIKKSKTPLMPLIKWSWSDNKIDIYCCKGNTDILLRNIQYFFKTINAKGLGPKVIEKLYNNGFNTIEKIISIKKDDIVIEGFKEKSIDNMINNIKKALTDIPLSLLMSASNKFGAGMGVKRLESILEKYPNIMETKNNIVDMVRKIDGFEEKTAKIFADNINNFKKFYKIIKDKVTIKKSSKKSNKLNGLKFVFTGFRNKELEKKIIENGGIVNNTISSNTDYLVIKDIDSSSSKRVKAVDLGITIITINDVLKML